MPKRLLRRMPLCHPYLGGALRSNGAVLRGLFSGAAMFRHNVLPPGARVECRTGDRGGSWGPQGSLGWKAAVTAQGSGPRCGLAGRGVAVRVLREQGLQSSAAQSTKKQHPGQVAGDVGQREGLGQVPG